MRKLFIAISLGFLLGGCLPTLVAAQQSSNQLPIRSARLVALEKQLRSGDVTALDNFWREIKQQGTPLVEGIPGDEKHVLVTFLWRGGTETKNVALFSDLPGVAEAAEENLLVNLPGTDVWFKSYKVHKDGVPENVPLMVTESNVSWALTEPMVENFAALWLADNAGSFLASGGAAFYHSPIQPEPLRSGCHGFSTYGNFVANEKLEIWQHTSQYFASQMINLEWVKHGAGLHQLFPAEADVKDDAGHALVTAYAAKRPDGVWSLMLINKDPSNAHAVEIDFSNSSGKPPAHFIGQVTLVTFGAEQYVWHSEGAKSHADPDGPPLRTTLNVNSDDSFNLPKASVTVLRGRID